MANTVATSPGTMADNASVGNTAWINPNNAMASDNAYADVTCGGGTQTSHYLVATNFGFSIPTGSLILGILVEVECYKGSSAGGIGFLSRIVKGGAISATELSSGVIPSSDAGAYLPVPTTGAPTNLWGETWTAAQINAADFGVAIHETFAGAPAFYFHVDHIRITVYYTEPPSSENSVKANIVVTNSQNNNTKADILILDNINNNSSKASILAVDNTINNSVKANIMPQMMSSPSSMANDATVGSVSWINPNNAMASDNTYATASLSDLDSNYLKATNFGFSILTGAIINGIIVEIERKKSGTGNIKDVHVSLVKFDGTIGTTNKATATAWPTSDTYVSYGSSTDLWGETWDYTKINDVDFGVVLSATQYTYLESATASVDHIRITVYYSEPPSENSVKANIAVTNSQNNNTKADILFEGQYPESVKTNIIRTNEVIDNSVKANLFTLTYIKDNDSIANIISKQSFDNNVKTSIHTLGTNPISVTTSIANTAIRQKKYDYRVFDANTRSYVSTWSNEVISVPTFKMVINSGPGEMMVKLARKFDSFGEDVDVKLFNKVECWVYDLEAPNGILLYSGYISGYTPVMEELKEYVSVTLLPYSAEMSFIALRNGTGATEITQSSLDPSQIFKNIVNYYKSDAPGHIDYTDSTIDMSSTTVTYTFKAYTVKEALDKAIELTPNDWYWRIDSDNLMYLKKSNMNVADHTFLIGKHINHLETQRRGEDLFNRIYYVGAETAGVALYRVYTNSASVSSYGIHSYKQVDSRVTETATADIMANRTLTKKKDPEIRTTIVIVDSNGFPNTRGYDIESVKPGQTMRIKNMKEGSKTVSTWDVFVWDVDIWDQTLSFSAADIIQIQSVIYTPNAITIQASSRTPEISKRIEDINRNWEENVAKNTPTTPTVV